MSIPNRHTRRRFLLLDPALDQAVADVAHESGPPGEPSSWNAAARELLREALAARVVRRESPAACRELKFFDTVPPQTSPPEPGGARIVHIQPDGSRKICMRYFERDGSIRDEPVGE